MIEIPHGARIFEEPEVLRQAVSALEGLVEDPEQNKLTTTNTDQVASLLGGCGEEVDAIQGYERMAGKLGLLGNGAEGARLVFIGNPNKEVGKKLVPVRYGIGLSPKLEHGERTVRQFVNISAELGVTAVSIKERVERFAVPMRLGNVSLIRLTESMEPISMTYSPDQQLSILRPAQSPEGLTERQRKDATVMLFFLERHLNLRSLATNAPGHVDID